MSKTRLKEEQLQQLISRYTMEVETLKYQIDANKRIIAELKNDLRAAKAESKAILKKEAAKSKRPVRRGRPPLPSAARKRRGRPAKKATETTATVEKPAAKKRGRPKSTTTAKAKPVARKRGRPKATPTTTKPVAKRRGRPKKVKEPASVAMKATQAAKKKRGRPAKTTKTATSNGVKKAAPKSKKAATTKGYRLSDWDNMVIKSLQTAGNTMVNSELLELAHARNKKEKLSLSDTQVKAKLAASIHKLANKKGAVVKVKHEGRGFAYALPEWMGARGKLKPEFKKK